MEGVRTMFTRGTSWNYISPFGRKRLPEYTYSGSDNSLMYIYFCSPLAELLVKFIPGWLAPNVITLLGLALSLAGYFLVHFHTPKFNEPCSSWVWFVLAFCTFAYQTLDNIDGKQARRTNTSSALGLFVDHGVDALNIVLSSQNVMALLQLGSRETAWACLAVWSATSTPFFFATWEEHFTGSLYLGPFNGPTDGVLIVCISYVITGLADDPTHLWNAGFGLGMSRAEAMISFYGMCVLFTVFGNIYSVHKELRLRNSQHFRQPWNSILATCHAMSLVVPFCLHLSVGYCIIGPHSTDLRTSFWFLGFSFLMLVFLG
jgi:ethanolaminephosphotransferase